MIPNHEILWKQQDREDDDVYYFLYVDGIFEGYVHEYSPPVPSSFSRVFDILTAWGITLSRGYPSLDGAKQLLENFWL